MRNRQSATRITTPRRKLYLAIATQFLLGAAAQASPSGGTVISGEGLIDQAGNTTTITQHSDRLHLTWDTFNVAADERVQFIQPTDTSVALNRILDNNGSRIFGQIDANGHVILMNPNGVLFGEGATLNVGSLVATGLAVDPDAFMNGHLTLSAIEGSDGAVINRGIINAATGGSVALVGKRVENSGLISAHLGAVTLAAGKEAVLTFDNQGLLGVRVTSEVLQDELGVDPAVLNSGDINAAGGRVLLTGSVSQDIFSQAVNAGDLRAKTSVVMHDDGSFTLGGGADVVNTGRLDVAGDAHDAGQVVMLGENVSHSGVIDAGSRGAGATGDVEIHARDTTLLTGDAAIYAVGDQQQGGSIKVLGDRVGLFDQSTLDASGDLGGGDIHIGGGFQGNNTNLRNASRTVVTRDTRILANAETLGDGGEIILWADDTTAFTGQIETRGGQQGGNGGFVEVSGKRNLKFDGLVDRSAPNGKTGELLLDPEEIIIVSGIGQQDDELDDAQILGNDGPGLTFTISTDAIVAALTTGDVSLRAEQLIRLNESDDIRIVAQGGNTNNLYFGLSSQGGRLDFSSGAFIDLGLGDLQISAYAGATLSGEYYANNIDIQSQNTSFHDVVFVALGEFTMLGAGSITSSETFRNTISTGNLIVRPRSTGGTAGSLNNVSITAFSASIEASGVTLLDAYIEDDFEFIGTGTRYPGFSVRGDNYVGGNLNVQTSDLTFHEDSRLEVGGISEISANWIAEFHSNSELFSRNDITFSGSTVQFDLLGDASIISGGIVDFGAHRLVFDGGLVQAAGGVFSSTSSLHSVNIVGNLVWHYPFADIIQLQMTGDSRISGDFNILAEGNIFIESDLFVGGVSGFYASQDIIFDSNSRFNPQSNVFLSAGRDIEFRATSNYAANELGFNAFILPEGNNVSMIMDAGRSITLDTTLAIGGSLVASAGTRSHAADDSFPTGTNGPTILVKGPVYVGEELVLRSSYGIEISESVSGEYFADNSYGVLQNLELHADGTVWMPWGGYDEEGHVRDVSVRAYQGARNERRDFTLSSGEEVVLPELFAFAGPETGAVGWSARLCGNCPNPASFNLYGNLDIEANNIEFTPFTAWRVHESNSNPGIKFTAANDLWIPNIVFSEAVSGRTSSITVNSGRDAIFTYDLDFNHAGILDLDIDAGRNIILGAQEGENQYLGFDFLGPQIADPGGRIFDSSGTDGDQLNLQLSAGGLIRQSYDVFTGGGDYTATASNFEFAQGVQINTDFSNDAQNSLVGTGHISLVQAGADGGNFSNVVLPHIRTQADCAIQEQCGNFSVTSLAAITDGNVGRTIRVFGDANFNSNSFIDLKSDQSSIQFNGSVGVDAGAIALTTEGGFSLADWRINGTATVIVKEIDGRSSDLVSNAAVDIGLSGGFATEGDLIFQGSGTRFRGSAELYGRKVVLEHDGDLVLDGLFLTGGPAGENSVINVTGNVRSSGTNEFFFEPATNQTLNLNIAGGLVEGVFQQSSPVTFNITGDLLLNGADNRISAIEILSAQNVELNNTTPLILNGINAENLKLQTSGNLTQTAPLAIAGLTEIVATNFAGIWLDNPQNQLNQLTLNIESPNTVEIVNAGDLLLGDIVSSSNPASIRISSADAGATLTQTANSTIELAAGGTLQLTADNMQLGAEGTSAIRMHSGTLILNTTNSLTLDGLIEGADSDLASPGSFRAIGAAAGGNTINIGQNAQFTLLSPTSFISLGEQNSTINISANLPVRVTSSSSIDPQSQNNQVNILAADIDVTELAFNAAHGDANNIIRAFDVINSWIITSDGAGQLQSGSGAIQFSGMSILQGGNQSDEFFIEAPIANLALLGGEGVNSLYGNLSDDSVDNIWTITGENQGTLNTSVLFENIQNLIGNGGDDLFTFSENASILSLNGGAGDDTFVLARGVVAGLIDGGEGTNTLVRDGLNSVINALGQVVRGDADYNAINITDVIAGTGTTTLVGIEGANIEWLIDGDGAVTATVLQAEGTPGTPNTFSGVTRIESTEGDNLFILRPGGSLSDGLLGNGTDTLHADTELANTWTINGINAGQVEADTGLSLVFEGIANLIGGDGNDLFDLVTGGSITGSLAGGSGVNTLRISDATAINNWVLDAQNSVTGVASFGGIQNLVGNGNADTFSVTGTTDAVSIDGGLGDNALVWSAGDLVLNLADSTANESLSFANIGSFTADAASNNTLMGANTENLWVLTAVGEGLLNDILFRGFNHLQGGTDTDSLRGFDADGVWQIGYESDVDLNALIYPEQRITFVGIELLFGGNADDVFELKSAPPDFDSSINLNGVIAVNGGQGQNHLYVGTESLWEIDALSGGVSWQDHASTLLFENIGSVGSYSAIFNINNIDTLIRSYRSDDGFGFVSFAAIANEFTLDLNNPDFSFSGINRFEGNGVNSRIIGINSSGIWRMEGFPENDLGYSTAIAVYWGDDRESRFLEEGNFDIGLVNFNRISGGSDDDVFYIYTDNSFSMDLQGGGGTNTLIANRDNTLNNTWIIDGLNSGTLNSSVIFQNIQHLEGNDGVDTVTFAPDSSIGSIRTLGGDDVIFMASGVIAGLLDGGTGNNLLNLGDLNSVVDILGNTLEGGDAVYEAVNFTPVTDGDGQFTVRGVLGIDAEWLLDAEDAVLVRYTNAEGQAEERRFSNVTRLEGEDGTNRFVLLENGALTGQIVGGTSLTAANGQNNTWTINGADSGTLTSATGQELVFQGIAQLIGGAANDLFDLVTGGTITGSLAGGSGINTLRISDATAVNNWVLGTQNSVTGVASFSGIQNLVGNGNADTFSVTGTTDAVSIDGGLGDNALVWSAGDLVLNLADNTANAISVININSVAADTANNNTLIGADIENLWTLTALNAGTLNELSFSGFDNLQGGSGVDTLVGLDADATWSLGDYEAGVILPEGRVSYAEGALAFVGMEHIAGGAGADVFYVYAPVTSVTGGAGQNRLYMQTGEQLTWQVNRVGGSVTDAAASFNLNFNAIQTLGVSAINPTSNLFVINDLTPEVQQLEGHALSADTLNFANIDGQVVWDMNNPLLAVQDIEYFEGNGANSTFIGSGDGWWEVGAVNTTYNNSLVIKDFGILQGGAGNDEFFIYGEDVAISIHGGAGENSLLGNMFSDISNAWTIDGVNSGTLNATVSFENIQTLIGNDGADTVTFAPDAVIGAVYTEGGDDVIFLASGVQAGLLDGGTGNNLLNLGNLNTVMDILGVTLDGGDAVYEAVNFTPVTDGEGQFTVRGVAGIDAEWLLDAEDAVLVRYTNAEGQAEERRFNNVTRLEGGDGTNRFVLLENGALTGRIVGGTSLTAANGQDNTWTLNAEDSGQVTGADGNTLIFQGIATLIGGDGNDLFDLVTGGSISGSLTGGGGNNTLRISDATAVNNWVLGAQNSVTGITGFSGIQTVIGNANDDIFAITGATDVALLDGGLGANSLNWSAGALQVNLADGALNGTLLVQNIGSFLADAAQANQLVGDNTDNLWILTGEAQGSVNGIVFDGFSNLQGGTGEDTLRGLDADGVWRIGGVSQSLTYADEALQFANMDHFQAGAGNDAFYIDTSGAQAFTLDGGAGDNRLLGNSDTLLDNNWTLDGEYSGTLNTLVRFAQIQHLQGNDGSDTVIFANDAVIDTIATLGGDDAVYLANGVVAGLLDGGTGNNVLYLGDLNAVIDILGRGLEGDASYDAVNFDIDGTGDGFVTVRGIADLDTEWLIDGDGSVTVVFEQAGENRSITHTSVSRLEGASGINTFVLLAPGQLADAVVGNGTDTLIMDNDLANTWTINGTNAGEVTSAAGNRLVFQGIANLIGSHENDLFDLVTGGSITGSLSGGGGVNTLRISDNTVANTWSLGEVNSVTGIAPFEYIQHLIGNQNADTFNISGLTDVLSIDGGLGGNRLTLVDVGDAVVDLQNALINDVFSFSNIAEIAVDTAAHTLIGYDADTTWTLTDPGRGALTSSAGALQFDGFTHLQGGAGDDRFVMAGGSVSGILHGGLGVNTLAAANGNNTWLVAEDGGALNDQAFRNMQHLVGGTGADAFSLASAQVQALSLDGGAGANSLTGFDQINTWVINGDATSSVTGLASFNNIQTFFGGAAADTFNVAAGVTLNEIHGGAGNDRFNIGANVTVANLYGDAGDDYFAISPGLTVSGIVDGGQGGQLQGDTLDLTAFTLTLAGFDLEALVGFAFSNFENILEPRNEGTYFGGNGTNVWYITGENQGRLEVLDGDNQGIYEFSGIHTLLGGTGNDTFYFMSDAAAVTTVIDGGQGGTNTLDLSAQSLINQWLFDGQNSGRVSNSANSEGNIFTNIAFVIGGQQQDHFQIVMGGALAGGIMGSSDRDTLTIATAETRVWNLGAEAGHSATGIAHFAGIEHLVGGSGADTFNLLQRETDILSIAGGGGDNQLNLLYQQAARVNLALGEADGLAFSDIQYFSAANSDSQLLGLSASGTWTLSGTNSGVVAYLIDGQGDALNLGFSGFGQLQGGDGDDHFELAADAQITGLVDGGAGDNTLRSADALAVHWTVDGANSGFVDTTVPAAVRFANMGNLRGGQAQNQFVINQAGSLTGGIQGGSTQDRLTHSGDQVQWLLALDAGVTGGTVAGVRFGGIEQLVAGGAGHHLRGADVNSTWNLGEGLLNTYVELNNATNLRVYFDGMAEFVGGAGDDVFNVVSAASLPRLIDGGAGSNSVNLQNLDADVHVGTSAAVALPQNALAVNLSNIDHLRGNNQRQTHLYGAGDQGYTWTISGLRSGQVTTTLVDEQNRLLSFENISAIIGGDHDDIFRMLTQDTLISIDGGGQVNGDFVDYSQINANLRVNLADALSGQSGVITGIEGVRGNNSGPSSLNTAELVAADGNNTWNLGAIAGNSLSDGVNDGVVSNGSQSVVFLDFNVLTGGTGSDTFNLLDGVLTGTINGTAGNNLFNIDVGRNNPGLIVNGGTGTDLLNLLGGRADMLATYTASAQGGQFVFASADTSYQVSYTGIDQLREQTLAQTLEIRGTNGADTIAIGDGRFNVNQGVAIEHQNKQNLVVRAGIDDTVLITDNIRLPGTFAVINGTLLTQDPANTSITAQELLLEATRGAGSEGARIRLSVDDLRLRNTVGAVYLQAQNGLNLAEMVSTGLFDVRLLNGDLRNSGLLTSSNQFRAAADNGNILLAGENQLAGALTLNARDVEVHNAATLSLMDVQADNLRLYSDRGIAGAGVVQVSGNTYLNAGGNINLENPLNDFNRVEVGRARDVTLVDRNNIVLADWQATGAVWLESLGLTVEGSGIRANSILLDAGAGSAILNGDLNTVGGSFIEVYADQILQNANILSGGATRLVARSSIQQNGLINAGGAVEQNAQAGDITVANGASTRGTQVTVSASGDLRLQDINADSIRITSGELVVSGGSLVATRGDIHVQSGDYQMSIGSLVQADQGTIRIVADNNVNTESDVRGNRVQIEAGGSVVMDGGSRIDGTQGTTIRAGEDVVVGEVSSGGTVTIDAERGAIIDGNGGGTNIVADSFVGNAGSGIGAGNALETRVNEVDIRTDSGDVRIDNQGDLVVHGVQTGNGNIGLKNEGDVTVESGAVVAGQEGSRGRVDLEVQQGDVKQSGPLDVPAIVGREVNIEAPGGAVGRGGLRVDADLVFVLAREKAGSIIYNPGATRVEYFTGSYKFDDYMTAVEPLEDINPAIFTNVRGYFYQDVSLLLPSDQRWDDEEE